MREEDPGDCHTIALLLHLPEAENVGKELNFGRVDTFGLNFFKALK